jgi:hypothetical protein
MTMHPDTIRFPTGAMRSGDAERRALRFDLADRPAPLGRDLRRGAAKYGDRNWESGFPASVVINHTLARI